MIHEDPDDQTDLQTEDLQTLTFDDLLSFAFQVAKGMEFLSSKNVIKGPHGGNALHLRLSTHTFNIWNHFDNWLVILKQITNQSL